MVIQNSYFEDSEFVHDPIKKYNKPYYLMSKFNSSVYYYMLLSENKITMNDAKLYGPPTKRSFIETRINYNVIQDMLDG